MEDLPLWGFIVLAHFMYVGRGSACLFPVEWQGVWYQSRQGDVRISSNSISRKGTCLQQQGDKYLMLNRDYRERKCYTCLVFTKWHENLLQYKESSCWMDESLETVCNQIGGDATLHTIVKVPSVPVPCPFQGPYVFSYANGSREQCDFPLSEIRPCADASKFKFHYKRCHRMHGTFNQELNFQCLATWNNGDYFLYGKFTADWLIEREKQYRCFMHSFYGTEGEMSMSADATCQGLQSPDLGVLTMKLSKEVQFQPRASCRFPDYFVRRTVWRDLTGRYRIEMDDHQQSFKIVDRFPPDMIQYKDSPDTSETRMVVRCVDYIHKASTGDNKEFITYTTNDSCVSGHQCMRINRRAKGVIELMIGSMLDDPYSSCTDAHFDQATKHVLISDDTQAIACPHPGSYSYMDQSSDCNGEFKVGCNNDNEIVIEKSCASNQQSVTILECLRSWEDADTTYIITQKPGDIRNAAVCLVFRQTEYGIEVQEDNECRKTRIVTYNSITYLLHTPAEKCRIEASMQSDEPPSGMTNDLPNIVIGGCVRTQWSLFTLTLSISLHFVIWRR